MARKNDFKHPYTRGFEFWLPIISEWCASDRYSETAKQYFRECLEEMEKSKDLLTIEERYP